MSTRPTSSPGPAIPCSATPTGSRTARAPRPATQRYLGSDHRRRPRLTPPPPSAASARPRHDGDTVRRDSPGSGRSPRAVSRRRARLPVRRRSTSPPRGAHRRPAHPCRRPTSVGSADDRDGDADATTCHDCRPDIRHRASTTTASTTTRTTLVGLRRRRRANSIRAGAGAGTDRATAPRRGRRRPIPRRRRQERAHQRPGAAGPAQPRRSRPEPPRIDTVSGATYTSGG